MKLRRSIAMIGVAALMISNNSFSYADSFEMKEPEEMLEVIECEETELETEFVVEETEPQPETELETEEAKSEPEVLPETEQEEFESQPETELETEEAKLDPEESEVLPETEPEEFEPQPETELETEEAKLQPEEPEIFPETETKQEEFESQPETELKTQETELQSEAPEILPETETEVEETEPQSETELETESETILDEILNKEEVTIKPKPDTLQETVVETKEESTEDETGDVQTETSMYWDESWYLPSDFRFVQVEKEYALVEGGERVFIYEQPDKDSKKVGSIPYFGLVYVLEEKDASWLYVESGEVRGFMERSVTAGNEYAEELVDVIGEEMFQSATNTCQKYENEAFTYTKTTVEEVLAPKQYALPVTQTDIYEYPNEDSRKVGSLSSGNLVYILLSDDTEWYFVESGDARGFVKKEQLLTGSIAEEIVKSRGEDETPTAKLQIEPEENESCYHTLLSVKTAAEGVGESICKYAESFVGKLDYVYGGTSLMYGADCSGFVQSVFGAYGIQLPRIAQDQGCYGEKVETIEEAKAGDIIYWESGPHVGIYLGNGKVVQCSGNSNNTYSNPGQGPTISSATYLPITSIRRYLIVTEKEKERSGFLKDGSSYSQKDMELIWAIVAQEDNGSYDGALAVISSAMNRTESGKWKMLGDTALEQLTAAGQYCYSLDDYWKARLNGNVPSYVKQAVSDCLEKGIRNHNYTSFRSRIGVQTGEDAVKIGGNWYFNS